MESTKRHKRPLPDIFTKSQKKVSAFRQTLFDSFDKGQEARRFSPKQFQGYNTNSGMTKKLSNDNRKLNLIGHKLLINSFNIALPSEKLYKN